MEKYRHLTSSAWLFGEVSKMFRDTQLSEWMLNAITVTRVIVNMSSLAVWNRQGYRVDGIDRPLLILREMQLSQQHHTKDITGDAGGFTAPD